MFIQVGHEFAEPGLECIDSLVCCSAHPQRRQSVTIFYIYPHLFKKLIHVEQSLVSKSSSLPSFANASRSSTNPVVSSLQKSKLKSFCSRVVVRWEFGAVMHAPRMRGKMSLLTCSISGLRQGRASHYIAGLLIGEAVQSCRRQGPIDNDSLNSI